MCIHVLLLLLLSLLRFVLVGWSLFICRCFSRITTAQSCSSQKINRRTVILVVNETFTFRTSTNFRYSTIYCVCMCVWVNVKFKSEMRCYRYALWMYVILCKSGKLCGCRFTNEITTKICRQFKANQSIAIRFSLLCNSDESIWMYIVQCRKTLSDFECSQRIQHAELLH